VGREHTTQVGGVGRGHITEVGGVGREHITDYWLRSLKSGLEQSCVSRGAEDTEPGSVEGSNHRDVGDWPGNPQSSEAALRPPTQESEGP
jgi:hypothetical protein